MENNKLLHLPANTTGVDYVCGDIHGFYDDLMMALDLLNFDKSVDRLLSVGDLNDRGPDSLKCLELIYEPYFYATKGNHESMMCDSLLRGDWDTEMVWARNGGIWATGQSRELKHLAEDVDKLPLIITVGDGQDRFNIVHAELMHKKENTEYNRGFELAPSLITDGFIPITNQIIDNWEFDQWDERAMIWGRKIIYDTTGTTFHDKDKMSLTFVGHTPMKEVVRKKQQMYLDTGLFAFQLNKIEECRLTLACPTMKTIHSYHPGLKTITQTPFSDVKLLV